MDNDNTTTTLVVESVVESVAKRPVEQPLLEDELLVEEISIDGMCGVY